MDQSDMYGEGRLSCCCLGTLPVALSIVGYTESGWIIGVYEAELSACLQETTTTKNQNLAEKHNSIQQSLLCCKEELVHCWYTWDSQLLLCTSWGSSQSQPVGTRHGCEAGFYQGSEWSLNEATHSVPPSWEAPDLGFKTRATGPVLFIFLLLWLPSQVLFLHKTVPTLSLPSQLDFRHIIKTLTL